MSAQESNIHIFLIIRDNAVVSRQIRNKDDFTGTAEQPEQSGDKWVDVTVQARWVNACEDCDFRVLSAVVTDVYTCDDVAGEWNNAQYVKSAGGFSQWTDAELTPDEILWVEKSAKGSDWEDDSWVDAWV